MVLKSAKPTLSFVDLIYAKMQEINSMSAILVLKKLKKALKISTDIQLSEILNVKPNTISTWKKRNSLDYKAIISLCELYEIDLNMLFSSTVTSQRPENNLSNKTPFISSDVQFQYCIGSRELMERLPQYHFPFLDNAESRAFQLSGNNMSPAIEENSVVVCQACDIKIVPDNSIVVIVSKVKGLFINRITKANKPNTYILSSENKFFSSVAMHITEIDEIWFVKAIVFYGVNRDNNYIMNGFDNNLQIITPAVTKTAS